MHNETGAIGLAVGITMGAVVGLAVVLIQAAMSEERARKFRMEEVEQVHYRSAEYAERARGAIDVARKRAKAKLEEA